MIGEIAFRVVSRYVQADEGEDSPSKGGVPPRWKEWLDKVHHGGTEKVSNPNPKTQGRFHEVSYSTALKYPKFFLQALKEYKEWAKKNPEDDDKKDTSGKSPDEKVERTSLTERGSSTSTELKEVFGNEIPGVEDIESMFSSGSGVSAKLRKVQTANNGIEVILDLENASGENAGKISRRFYRHEGKLKVFHSSFILNEDQQGKGVAKKVLKNSLKAYEKMGVEQIRTNPGFTNGKYTWARMGFNASPETLKEMKREFKSYLEDYYDVTGEAAGKILDNVSSVRDLASIRIGNQHAGKDYLLDPGSKDWNAAFINLDSSDPGLKILKSYIDYEG